jgi:type VI secretion system protein ImpG
VFSKYYQSELSYLREVGKEFARINPTLAGLLSERGGDPDVERLLEGFAFLTARIRERMDDAVPEVVHGLTELLLPHYLRTLPACSIVEFSPPVKAMRGRQRAPAGSPLGTNPVAGTSCLFRTTADVDLLPLTLQGVALEPLPVSAPSLRLSFQGPDQGLREVLLPEGLRLFIHAEPGVSAMLMLWLQRHCRGVRVQAPRGSSLTSRCCPGPAVHPRDCGCCRSTSPCRRSSSSSR